MSRVLTTILPFYILLAAATGIKSISAGTDDLSQRGAANKKQLASALAQATKVNDFEILSGYHLTENDLAFLKKNAPEKVRRRYESLEPEPLKLELRKNFDNLIQTGIRNKFTWADAELTDVKEEKINDYTYRVYVSLQDMKGIILQLSFDTIKVRDRWFLFQSIKTEQCLAPKDQCPKP